MSATSQFRVRNGFFCCYSLFSPGGSSRLDDNSFALLLGEITVVEFQTWARGRHACRSIPAPFIPAFQFWSTVGFLIREAIHVQFAEEVIKESPRHDSDATDPS